MKTLTKFAITLALSFLAVTGVRAQDLIANVYGREMQSLNGKWDAVVDLYDQGRKNKIYLNCKPEGKTDFYEYAFENGLRLDVPSDWNTTKVRSGTPGGSTLRGRTDGGCSSISGP